MCDINKKTRIKRATIYKVAVKDKEGNLFSYFAGWPVKLGPVGEFQKPGRLGDHSFTHHETCEPLYNENLIGRTSGFAKLSVAKKLYDYNDYNRSDGGDVSSESALSIVRLTIGGSIMKGSSAMISSSLPDYEVVLAGTEVFSIKEVFFLD